MLVQQPILALLQTEMPEGPIPGLGSSGSSMGITALLLIILVGGLAFALYATKRFGFVRKPGHGKLEILETRPLGGRQFLVVGKYGRDSFLLGVCPGRIEYLARLDEENQQPFEHMLKSESAES